MTTWTKTFPGRPEYVREARAWAARCLRDCDCPLADDAVLCISEYFTNALRYTRSGLPRGEVTVRIAVAVPVWLRVEVRDQGVPADRCPPAGPGLGEGLRIVRRLAESDGATISPAGRCAWFRMDWRGHGPGPGTGALAPELASTSSPKGLSS